MTTHLLYLPFTCFFLFFFKVILCDFIFPLWHVSFKLLVCSCARQLSHQVLICTAVNAFLQKRVGAVQS